MLSFILAGRVHFVQKSNDGELIDFLGAPGSDSFNTSTSDLLLISSIDADLGPKFPQRGSCSILRNPRPLSFEPFLFCDRIAVASTPYRLQLTAFSQRCRSFPGFYEPCLFPNYFKRVSLLDSSGIEARIVEPNGPTGAELLSGNGFIHVTSIKDYGLRRNSNINNNFELTAAPPGPSGVLGLESSSFDAITDSIETVTPIP